MSNSKFNLVAVACFLTLAFIRGTTPLMAYFAVSNLNSAGLVVSCKSAISLALFIATIAHSSFSNHDEKSQIKRNFRDKHIYWKIPFMGLMQTAAPYLLVVYSLQFLPPTLLGVFMAVTPWFTILFERLPFVKIKSTINSYVKIGMVLGFISVIMIVVPVIQQSSANCNSISGNATSANSTMSLNNTTPNYRRTYSEVYDACLHPVELTYGMLALVFGSILWAISTVFWRANRGEIHYSVASFGQNFTAGVFAVICWVAAKHSDSVGETYWLKSRTIVGIIFLGLATGWLATILVQHLSKKIGPKPTNQVLAVMPAIAFIEDCIFVKSITSIHPWLIALEIIGILLLSGAVFLTNLKDHTPKRMNSMLSENLIDPNGHSEYNTEHGDIQDEVDKYRILPPISDEESSSFNEEEEIETNKVTDPSESSYPPLREIVGDDDLNRSITLDRKANVHQEENATGRKMMEENATGRRMMEEDANDEMLIVATIHGRSI
eukprot:gene16934-18641_t